MEESFEKAFNTQALYSFSGCADNAYTVVQNLHFTDFLSNLLFTALSQHWHILNHKDKLLHLNKKSFFRSFNQLIGDLESIRHKTYDELVLFRYITANHCKTPVA